MKEWLNMVGTFVKVWFIFFFKQKTAYEIKECDWSSDVCSSDLPRSPAEERPAWIGMITLKMNKRKTHKIHL